MQVALLLSTLRAVWSMPDTNPSGRMSPVMAGGYRQKGVAPAAAAGKLLTNPVAVPGAVARTSAKQIGGLEVSHLHFDLLQIGCCQGQGAFDMHFGSLQR